VERKKIMAKAKSWEWNDNWAGEDQNSIPGKVGNLMWDILMPGGKVGG